MNYLHERSAIVNKMYGLFLSYAIPIRASGTPVVVRNFLNALVKEGGYSADDITLIGRPISKNECIRDCTLFFKSITIPTPSVGTSGEILWKAMYVFIGSLVGFFLIVKYKPKYLFAFFRDETSLFIGYILHLLTRKPLNLYFFDLYLENYPKGLSHLFAKWLFTKVLRRAKNIFVLTDGMAEYFSEQYGVVSKILPHIAEKMPMVMHKQNQKFENSEQITIGYVGSVNSNRIYSLIKIYDLIRDSNNYKLDVFTTTPEEYFDLNGLHGPRISIMRIMNQIELNVAISKCDVLYLPDKMPNAIASIQNYTGFPTKAIDYLISGVPILVHTNEGSNTQSFFLKNDCGIVCTEDADLLHQLQRISKDRKRRQALRSNGAKALEQFSGGQVIKSFLTVKLF